MDALGQPLHTIRIEILDVHLNESDTRKNWRIYLYKRKWEREVEGQNGYSEEPVECPALLPAAANAPPDPLCAALVSRAALCADARDRFTASRRSLPFESALPFPCNSLLH